VRGIAARRRDTAPFIAETQMGLLRHLAQASDLESLPAVLPAALAYLQTQARQLQAGRVPLTELLISVKLHREARRYRVKSSVAKAAIQLRAAGKTLKPGQRIRLLFTRGEPGVWAWDQPAYPDPEMVDTKRYLQLLVRAAAEILSPLGVMEEQVASWVMGRATQVSFL